MHSFKRNLLVGYSVSLLLLLVSAIASYISIHNLLESTELVNHTNKVIKGLERVVSQLKDAETGQRGFLITGEEEFEDRYKTGRINTLSGINNIEILISDNDDQKADAVILKDLVNKRLDFLQKLIDQKRDNLPITTENMLDGNKLMTQTRLVIDRMSERENILLDARTETLNKFANSTPVLILVASLLAILVTVISFLRVNSDFNQRLELQKELLEKDRETSSRLEIIQSIATKISAGDYKVRVNDEGQDVLGSLGTSLNKMAESLDQSFEILSEKEWLQTGIAKLNEEMLGDKNTENLTASVLSTIIQYTNSQAGTFYLLHQDDLILSAGYAIDNDNVKKYLEKGQGLLGQVADSGKPIMLDGLTKDDFAISFTLGKVKPHSIYVFPVLYNQKVMGVIEISAMHDFSQSEKEFFEAVTYNAGIAINMALNREKVQELLSETQAQAEELQVQHNELENINAELEAQTQKLQASEEELKVQQEELMQANQEMEERSRLLEERNQMIAERNVEIKKKAEELEITTKYKSEFLANMSHELRTPLNSVLLLSRLLSDNNEKNLTPQQIEYAEVIQSAGQGLLLLIDEILDLSKIEAGKMEMEISKVSVSEITSDLQTLFEPVAKEKNIELHIHVDENVPGTIDTDKMRLEQVLKNLVSNALKFTKTGSVSLRVNPAANKKGYIDFSVIDTGIGIPADKQDLIFEAFQQADGSTRRNFGGTGLGLSISRQLSKLLGGDIAVKSSPGKGSQFTVTIPVSQAEIKPAPIAEKVSFDEYDIPQEKSMEQNVNLPIPPNIPDDREATKADDKIILIVEDDTNFAKALLDYTHSKGYKGIVAVRGDEGIELAMKHKPIGILLDIQLPVKDGWQVMEELKSNPDTRHIPVHIMSSQQVKKESIMRGAVDFINKPVALEQLNEIFRKIEMVLDKKNKKVLIIEENPKHAKALSYFLETCQVNSEISTNVNDSVDALNKKDVDCVILDMGIPAQNSYEVLEKVKSQPGFENLPVIIFTGKSLSKKEETRIKQYADSIVIKTAHSYQRILDEVSLFLHLVEEGKEPKTSRFTDKVGNLGEVLANKKVLMVDDDVRNIFSMSKILEAHKMTVLTAIDGKDALNQMAENPDVSVVLMDIMMPEMDGYEAIREIRKNPRNRNLPIIAITAKAMTGDREKCIEAGASDYISKPIDIDQLLSLLRVWLFDTTLTRK